MKINFKSSIALLGFIGIVVQPAQAEVWKCVGKDNAPPYYTETPSFGDDVTCEEVVGSKFSKPGPGAAKLSKARDARKSAADSRKSKSSKSTKADKKPQAKKSAAPKPAPKKKPSSDFSTGKSKKKK